MKKDLPPEVFTQIYQPPVSKGDGYDRDNLLKADKLLNEAGWVLKGQQRVNATTGQPLSFELLLPVKRGSCLPCRRFFPSVLALLWGPMSIIALLGFLVNLWAMISEQP